MMDERIQRKVEKLEHQCQKEAKEFARKVQELQKSNQVNKANISGFRPGPPGDTDSPAIPRKILALPQLTGVSNVVLWEHYDHSNNSDQGGFL